MSARTVSTLLFLLLVLILIMTNIRSLAVILLVLYGILLVLSRYRALAMLDVPLHELNERYAVRVQPNMVEDGETDPPLPYRSHYILLDSPPNDEHLYPMVHYVDNGGPGPVLVALHGIMDSAHAWQGWMQEIGADYRIVALDLPGFGLTGPFLGGEYSPEAWVAFLDTFVETLGIERFHLAGNSLGGMIAWHYALEYPDKVEKLILVDPAGYPQPVPQVLNLITLPGVSAVVPVLTPRWIFSRYVKEVFGDKSKVDQEMVDRFFEISLRPQNRPAMVHIFKLMKAQSHDLRASSQIPSIAVPVMMMWGEEDGWISIEHLESWQRDCKTIQRTVVYPGVGHVPHEEIPEQSARDAREFLNA